MNTLNISQIFSQIDFYQENYLRIIHDPAQYYIPVAEATIQIWPFKSQQLCLGDLLQLWFSKKWTFQNQLESQFNTSIFQILGSCDRRSDLNDALHSPHHFIYSICGSLLTGFNQANVWDIETAQVHQLNTNNSAQYYFQYQTLTRPRPNSCKQISLTI